MAQNEPAKPVRVHPDSTEDYSLEDFLKMFRDFNKDPAIRKIDDSNKEFARVLAELKNIREWPASGTREKQLDALQALAKDLKKQCGLKTHDKNRLMNTVLIDAEKYKARKKTNYKIADVPLYLLFAHPEKPIHGRIAMTKQVFLTINEILGKENVENPKFIPYRYGPYSFLLTHIISNLEYDGILHVQGRKNTSSEKFTLTEKGMITTKRKFARLPAEIRAQLVDRRKGWDQNHTRGILAYVYNKYPEYAEKSLLKDKYKSITWGRARG